MIFCFSYDIYDCTVIRMIFWILAEINLEKDLQFSTSGTIHPGINPQTNQSEGVTALLDQGNTPRISPNTTDVLQKNPIKT